MTETLAINNVDGSGTAVGTTRTSDIAYMLKGSSGAAFPDWVSIQKDEETFVRPWVGC